MNTAENLNPRVPLLDLISGLVDLPDSLPNELNVTVTGM